MTTPELKAPEPARFVLGDLIEDRYEVEQPLAEGGFAAIYRCLDRTIGRKVALKILKPLEPLNREEPEETQTRRSAHEELFKREARCAATVKHPNIVTIHDFGMLEREGAHLPYIVMELLDGPNLRQEIARMGRMSPEMAVDLLLPVLEALGRAHEAGIVHKDLKPDNLIFVEGRLMLVDFGIARVMGEASLTVSGEMSGTLHYLAPEYLLHKEATPALDVYQMGLILAEMIIGLPVLKVTGLRDLMRQYNSGEVEIPHALEGTVLEPLLRKCLHRDPVQRYPDGYGLARALQAISIKELRAELATKGIMSTRTEPFMEAIHKPRPGAALDSGPSRARGERAGFGPDDAIAEPGAASAQAPSVEAERAGGALAAGAAGAGVSGQGSPIKDIDANGGASGAKAQGAPPSQASAASSPDGEAPGIDLRALRPAPAAPRRRGGVAWWVYLLGALVACALVGGALVTWGGVSIFNDVKKLQTFEDSPIVPVGQSPSKGYEDALVVIVVFSDFESREAIQLAPILRQIGEDYREDVRLVFKNSIPPKSRWGEQAARAALAAHAQGAFWAYHDILLQNEGKLERRDLARYADRIGLDADRFEADMEGAEVKAALESDRALAEALEVEKAPTCFVNGVRLEGVKTLDAFNEVIDSEVGIVLDSISSYRERVEINRGD